MKGKKIEAVPVFRDKEGHGILSCPYCARLQGIGIGEAERGSDCELTESGSLAVFTVPGPVPDEAKQIDKKARRIQNILFDRSTRGGWWAAKWSKPTTAYLAAWENLKARAAELNKSILKENHMTVIRGILIRPDMKAADAFELVGNLTSEEIHSLPHNDAVTLLVLSKGGTVQEKADGNIDFSIPDNRTPEEKAEQALRSQERIKAYLEAI